MSDNLCPLEDAYKDMVYHPRINDYRKSFAEVYPPRVSLRTSQTAFLQRTPEQSPHSPHSPHSTSPSNNRERETFYRERAIQPYYQQNQQIIKPGYTNNQRTDNKELVNQIIDDKLQLWAQTQEDKLELKFKKLSDKLDKHLPLSASASAPASATPKSPLSIGLLKYHLKRSLKNFSTSNGLTSGLLNWVLIAVLVLLSLQIVGSLKQLFRKTKKE